MFSKCNAPFSKTIRPSNRSRLMLFCICLMLVGSLADQSTERCYAQNNLDDANADPATSEPGSIGTNSANNDPASFHPYPAPDIGYVTDLAKIFTLEQEEGLESLLLRTEDSTGVELAVVTLQSIDDYPGTPNQALEYFAAALFNRYGVGNLPANDGIMLVVALKDRKSRIQLGSGYERIHDRRAADIMAGVIIPRFKQNDYPGGIRAGIDALLASEFTGTQSSAQSNQINSRTNQHGSSANANNLGLVVFFIVILIALVLIALSLFRNGKNSWGWVCVGLVLVIIIAILRLLVSILDGISSINFSGSSRYVYDPLNLHGNRWGSSGSSGSSFGSGGGFSGGGSSSFGGGFSSGGGASGSW